MPAPQTYPLSRDADPDHRGSPAAPGGPVAAAPPAGAGGQRRMVASDQARVVRRYLSAIENEKPGRSSKRTAESIGHRILKIDELLVSADPLTRLHLVQERTELHTEQVRLASDSQPDRADLERHFIRVAKAYGDRTGVTYAAWRQVGVETGVLERAGIVRGRSSGPPASRGAQDGEQGREGPAPAVAPAADQPPEDHAPTAAEPTSDQPGAALDPAADQPADALEPAADQPADALEPAAQVATEQPPTEQPPTEQPPTEQAPTDQPPTEQPAGVGSTNGAAGRPDGAPSDPPPGPVDEPDGSAGGPEQQLVLTDHSAPPLRRTLLSPDG